MTSGDSASSTVVNDTKRTEATPDASAAGFLDHAPNPLRYDGQPNDPDEVVGVLSSLMPQGARVLDVGCGTGSVSIQLIANRGLSLIGVEPDEERAQRARDRGVTVRAARLTPELIAELGSFWSTFPIRTHCSRWRRPRSGPAAASSRRCPMSRIGLFARTCCAADSSTVTAGLWTRRICGGSLAPSFVRCSRARTYVSNRFVRRQGLSFSAIQSVFRGDA
jgi:hypothetical protein